MFTKDNLSKLVKDTFTSNVAKSFDKKGDGKFKDKEAKSVAKYIFTTLMPKTRLEFDSKSFKDLFKSTGKSEIPKDELETLIVKSLLHEH